MLKNPSKKKLREFGLFIGFSFPIVIGWMLPKIAGHEFRFWTLWIGIIFIFLSLINPKSLYYPYKFWFELGNFLGWVNSHILLGFIYFVVLIPISFVMRIFGYDPLRIRKLNQKTYREKTSQKVIDLNKIF